MLAFLVHPLVLIGFMWLVARHSADLDLLRAFLIVFGAGIFSWVLSSMLHPIAGTVGYIVVLPWALINYCELSLKEALIVTGLFMAWLIGWQVFWLLLLS